MAALPSISKSISHMRRARFLYLTLSKFRVAETLPQEVLTKMHAPPKPDYPVLQPNDLANFDGFICGIPTRFGCMPAQFKVGIYIFSFLNFIGLEPAFLARPSGMVLAISGNRAS